MLEELNKLTLYTKMLIILSAYKIHWSIIARMFGESHQFPFSHSEDTAAHFGNRLVEVGQIEGRAKGWV